MEIHFHRMLQRAVQPAQPQVNAYPEQIVPQGSALYQDELNLHRMATAASGIPAVGLLNDAAALKLGALQLPLNGRMEIRRGFGGKERTEIRNWNGDIRIDRPGRHQDEQIRAWRGQSLEIENARGQKQLSMRQFGRQIEADFRAQGRDFRLSEQGQTLSLDRPGVDQDVSFRRVGNRIDVDYWDSSKDLSISRERTSQGQKIEIDGWGSDRDAEITQRGQRIEIDRWGFERDVEIEQRNGRIEVDFRSFDRDFDVSYSARKVEIDRRGFDDDLSLEFSRGEVKLDRWGLDNDVTYRLRGNTLTIDRFGMDKDVEISQVSPGYILEEAGLRVQVNATGLQLLSVQIDEDFDISL